MRVRVCDCVCVCMSVRSITHGSIDGLLKFFFYYIDNDKFSERIFLFCSTPSMEPAPLYKLAGGAYLRVKWSVFSSRRFSRERLEILTSGLQHVVVLPGTSRPFFSFWKFLYFRGPKGGCFEILKKKFSN